MQPGVVVVMSFGFKHTFVPPARLVLDVRDFPNPFYRPDLRGLSGQDQEVSDWFYSRPTVLEKLDTLYEKLVMGVMGSVEDDLYRVSVGCTGGRHRSVFVAEQLVDRAMKDHTLKDILFIARHRDLLENTA